MLSDSAGVSCCVTCTAGVCCCCLTRACLVACWLARRELHSTAGTQAQRQRVCGTKECAQGKSTAPVLSCVCVSVCVPAREEPCTSIYCCSSSSMCSFSVLCTCSVGVKLS